MNDLVNYEKVYLPGESPWVEVLARHGGRLYGRISNKLFPEFSAHEQAQVFGSDPDEEVKALPVLHSFKKGDELWFRKNEDGEWVPDDESQNH